MPEVPEVFNDLLGKQTVDDVNRMLSRQHNDRLATAICECYSGIPKAIDAYFANRERIRLEREVIENLTKWRKLRTLGYGDSVPIVLWARSDLDRATDALIEFEAHQHQVKK